MRWIFSIKKCIRKSNPYTQPNSETYGRQRNILNNILTKSSLTCSSNTIKRPDENVLSRIFWLRLQSSINTIAYHFVNF